MILRLLCIWLVSYSLLSSLILSNLKHEVLNRLRSTMAANVLRSAICPTAVDGTDDNMLWNGSEEDGSVRSECKKDGNSLTGKSRQNLTCLVY
jgi:hypothetical protein